MESGEQQKPKHREEYGVLPPNFGGGPKGLGVPEDRMIRDLEWHLIYKKLREAAKNQCLKEYAELGECLKQRGAFFIRCRPQNLKMKNCQLSWFNNEEFKNKVTEQYLAERAEFRRTGVTKKQKEKAARKERDFEEWLEHKQHNQHTGT